VVSGLQWDVLKSLAEYVRNHYHESSFARQEAMRGRKLRRLWTMEPIKPGRRSG
jgi:hypothetical protein